jgi:mRNA-degrading endonuclease RelE of RelBE toxin-antitoxin system
VRRTIIWTDDAVGDIVALATGNSRQATRVREAVARFGRGEAGDIKKLQGRSNQWRLRVGDWRVVYEERTGQTVIVAVDNRRDAYSD